VAVARSEQPDLILMDVVMPGLNGFQATRQLSRASETADIPVVIVTTKDQETDRVWGTRQGAKGYLVKPVDEGNLVRTITELLG
jgi:twitching motility two-component system response regulator PilH